MTAAIPALPGLSAVFVDYRRGSAVRLMRVHGWTEREVQGQSIWLPLVDGPQGGLSTMERAAALEYVGTVSDDEEIDAQAVGAARGVALERHVHAAWQAFHQTRGHCCSAVLATDAAALRGRLARVTGWSADDAQLSCWHEFAGCGESDAVEWPFEHPADCVHCSSNVESLVGAR